MGAKETLQILGEGSDPASLWVRGALRARRAHIGEGEEEMIESAWEKWGITVLLTLCVVGAGGCEDDNGSVDMGGNGSVDMGGNGSVDVCPAGTAPLRFVEANNDRLNCGEAVDVIESTYPAQIIRDELGDLQTFVAGRLFPESGVPGLERYCFIDVCVPETQHDRSYRAIQGAEGGEVGLLDPVAVIPMGVGDLANWEKMSDDFLDAAGRPTTIPTRSDVIIALVDTWETNPNADWTQDAMPTGGATGHGLTLGRIMQALLCTDGDPAGRCLARVRPYLGIRNNVPALEPNGGSQSELAKAIYQAVQDASSQQRLIINLSLGWAPVPKFSTGRPSAAAVADALRYARCRGTIVVAAAGNNLARTSGNGPTGAVYPAAFPDTSVYPSSLANEDFTECAEFGSMASPTPFIVSAGAITTDDAPAAFTRRTSATHVAVGQNGLARLNTTDGSTAPSLLLNGTSVSAAVISASAAAYWALNPSLDASDVLAALGQQEPAPGTSVLARSGTADLPRIRVCDMNAALSCRVETSTRTTPGQGTMETNPGMLEPKTCDNGTLTVRVKSGEDPNCLTAPSVDLQPRINEQPGCDPCQICFGEIVGSQEVNVYIEADGPYDAQWLELTDPSGSPEVIDIGSLLGSNPSYPQYLGPLSTIGSHDPSGSTARIIWTEQTTGETTASDIPVY